MAAQGADVEVLAVSDDDCAGSGAIDGVPLRQQSRRRGDILAAYRRLGVPEVRRHRLGLESGTLSSAEPDLIAALSELVGHDCYPGLWCLAPWRRDGHPDHDAVGLRGGGGVPQLQPATSAIPVRGVGVVRAGGPAVEPRPPVRTVGKVRARKNAAVALTRPLSRVRSGWPTASCFWSEGAAPVRAGASGLRGCFRSNRQDLWMEIF